MAGHLKSIKAKPLSHHPDVFRPSIHLDEDQLKQIKNWEVGEKYTLILEVVQQSKSINSNKKISASFDIMKIGTPNKKFNNKIMEDFRAGKLMNGKRPVRSFNDAIKMASE